MAQTPLIRHHPTLGIKFPHEVWRERTNQTIVDSEFMSTGELLNVRENPHTFWWPEIFYIESIMQENSLVVFFTTKHPSWEIKVWPRARRDEAHLWTRAPKCGPLIQPNRECQTCFKVSAALRSSDKLGFTLSAVSPQPGGENDGYDCSSSV